MSHCLEDVFRFYDQTNDAQLNLREFTMCVESMGFGAIGHSIFHELDKDESGTISYRELVASLHAKRGSYTVECQKLLTAMSFSMINTKHPAKAMTFDNTKWSTDDLDELRATIHERMLGKLARPADCWAAFLSDQGSERRLTCEQFCSAMRRVLGFDGDQRVLELAYAELDDDSSNEVSVDEFINWMLNKPQRRRLARSLSLASTRDLSTQPPLNKVKWSPGTLRNELRTMLEKSQVSSLDLLMAYDKSEDGYLCKKEFLAMVKALVGDEAVWYEGVKDAAIECFSKIAGKDKQLDIEEFARWMPYSPEAPPPPETGDNQQTGPVRVITDAISSVSRTLSRAASSLQLKAASDQVGKWTGGWFTKIASAFSPLRPQQRYLTRVAAEPPLEATTTSQ
jgi:Ca2+-binding EF-hand superfamily protein